MCAILSRVKYWQEVKKGGGGKRFCMRYYWYGFLNFGCSK